MNKTRGQRGQSSVFRVLQQVVKILVKPSDRSMRRYIPAAIQYSRGRQCLRYFIFTVAFSLFQRSLKLNRFLRGKKCENSDNRKVDLAADGWKFSSKVEVTRLSGYWDIGCQISHSDTECLGGGCDSSVSVASPGEISGKKNDGKRADNLSPLIGNEVQEFLHGALFALPIALVIFLVSSPRDPWGGLPNPYMRRPNIRK